MGTLASAQQRANQFVNPKRQGLYLRKQFDPTNRDEKTSLWPRGDAFMRPLRDLTSFSQEQKELENNEATDSKDPRKKEYGAYSPVSQSAPIYGKPGGRMGLPVEDTLLSMFFTGFRGKGGAASETLTSVTSTSLTATVATGTNTFHAGGVLAVAYTDGSYDYCDITAVVSVAGAVNDTHTITVNALTPIDTIKTAFKVIQVGVVVTTVTSAVEFSLGSTDNIYVGHPIYFGDELRHVIRVDYATDTIVINTAFETTPTALSSVFETGQFYYFDDDVKIPLGSALSRSDIVGDLVENVFLSDWSMEMGTDGYLQHSFTMGALKVRTGIGTSFMQLPSYAVDGRREFEDCITVDSVTASTAAVLGGTSITIPAPGTVTPVQGIAVRVGNFDYIADVGTTSTNLVVKGGFRAAVASGDTVTILGSGNYAYANSGGITTTASVTTSGSTTITLSGALNRIPDAGIPFFVGGRVYVTGEGSTASSIALETQVEEDIPASTTISFATKRTVGLYAAQMLDPYMPIKNTDTDELFWNGDGGGLTIKNDGSTGYLYYDTQGSVHSIRQVWAGMEGGTLELISDYDGLDIYFPTATSAEGEKLQQRHDFTTFFGSEKFTNKSINISVNKSATADEEERSLDDFAGLPDDDVREYTIELTANFKPWMFKQRYQSKMLVPSSFQTTVGNVKWRRFSVFSGSITLSEPTREANENRTTTSLSANVYSEDTTVPAFVLGLA